VEARAILDSIAFDLLVVDIMMPGETGLEFLADIRKQNDVPALFLTAMSKTEDRIEGLEAGADDYMSKPFEPRELVLRIQRILSRKRTTSMAVRNLVFGPFQF
ncbi:MAG: response regulator transcription factor, partial [Alphaproteobacteria bacterium]